MKIAVDRATPVEPPIRAVVTVIPEAAPALPCGTDPRMALWLGELNMAQPSPISTNGKRIRTTVESRPREAMKN